MSDEEMRKFLKKQSKILTNHLSFIKAANDGLDILFGFMDSNQKIDYVDIVNDLVMTHDRLQSLKRRVSQANHAGVAQSGRALG